MVTLRYSVSIIFLLLNDKIKDAKEKGILVREIHRPSLADTLCKQAKQIVFIRFVIKLEREKHTFQVALNEAVQLYIDVENIEVV